MLGMRKSRSMRTARQLGRRARLSARFAATNVLPQPLVGEVIATRRPAPRLQRLNQPGAQQIEGDMGGIVPPEGDHPVARQVAPVERDARDAHPGIASRRRRLVHRSDSHCRAGILVTPDVREMHLATPPNLLSSGFRMDARRHSRKQVISNKG